MADRFGLRQFLTHLRNFVGHARARLLAPSHAQVLFVALLTVAPTLLTLATKTHKVVHQSSPLQPIALVFALIADLRFSLLWALFWLIFLYRARGTAQTWLRRTAQGFTVLWLVLVVVEHAFWITTGALLNASILVFSLQNFPMLRKIVMSEVGPLSIVAVSTAALLPVVLLALPPVRRRLASKDAVQKPLAWKWLILAAVAAIVPHWLPNALPAKLQPLRGSPMAGLVQTAIESSLGVEQSHETVAEIAPIAPLLVVRNAQTKPYNVVLVVLESTRALSTTLYNPALKTTPFMNQLAKKGVRAEFAFTTIPHTTKSLLPVHCGIAPKISATFDEASPGSIPTDCLARILRRQGWATGYFMSSESVFERNRDLVAEFGFDSLVAKEELDAKGDAKGWEEINYFGYEDRALLAPAMRWVDAQNGAPFFQAFLTLTPHHPYVTPKSWKKQDFAKDGTLNSYLNAIAYQDAFLQDLYNAYEKRGLNDKTVWVFIGDHGEAFGEHGVFQHDSALYDEILRIPLLVVAPGQQPRVATGLWQNIDVLPTVLDALQLPIVKGELPGKSLLSTQGHEELFFSCWHHKFGLGLRSLTQKTLWNYDRKPIELYDLIKDPLEMADVATATDAKVLEERKARMQRWKAESNARWESQASLRKAPFVSKSAPKIAHPADIVFGDFARLLSYDVEKTDVKAGDAVWATLIFQVLRDPEPGWQFFTHLNGPDDAFLRLDHVPVEGSYPVSKWKKGEYVTDHAWLRVDTGAPSGTYDLTIGFYNSDDGDKRSLVAGKGLPIDVDKSVYLSEWTVHNADRPPKPQVAHYKKLSVALKGYVHPLPIVGPQPLQVVFGDAVRVFAVDGDGQKVHRGDKVVLRYHFQVLRVPPKFCDLFVHFVGQQKRFLNDSHIPVKGGYPTKLWQVGDIIEDEHEWTVPIDWPLGKISVYIGMWGPSLATPHQRLPATGAGLPIDAEARALAATIEILK